jgi:predicted metal-dependent peptidase
MLNDVIKISKNLLYDQPFYGSVLLSLQKEINKKCDTAGVGLNGVMYKLLINPDFWSKLTDNHKKGLLIHELGHIVNFHLTNYKHLKNHKIANIAMDIYINQHIPNNLLPPGGCTYDKFNVPKGLSTNEYYDLLIDPSNQNQTCQNALQAMCNGESQCQDNNGQSMQVPEHDWEDITEASDAVQKIVQKSTEQMLSQVVKEVKQSNPGSIPGGLEELLDALSKIEPPKFNWRAYVRRFVGTSTKSWSNKTRRKKSKRFTGMPGLREKFYSNILVAIDTSWSVSIDDLKEFQNELVHLHKTGHDLHIVLCDTKINDQFKFNPRKPLSVEGRGGTDFQPVIDLYNKNLRKYSCLIYLSDGEAHAPENARGNILWVHGSNHYINETLPGRKVQLN